MDIEADRVCCAWTYIQTYGQAVDDCAKQITHSDVHGFTNQAKYRYRLESDNTDYYVIAVSTISFGKVASDGEMRARRVDGQAL